MLTGKNPRIPKRQLEEINGDESLIYSANAGSGINRKPYATDEYQNLIPEYIKDQEEQEKIDERLNDH